MKKVSEQEGKSWEEYMKEDIPIMLACDGIFMLSNYHGSRGARLELYVAEALGMEVMHEVEMPQRDRPATSPAFPRLFSIQERRAAERTERRRMRVQGERIRPGRSKG